MARRTVLLDTSFVLALENRDDPHHERAKSLDRELTAESCPYLVHLGVLLEIADGYARLGRRRKAIELLHKFETEEGYALCAINEPLFAAATDLYRARPDKEWSLTDCLSFALMREQDITEALTADGHFRQAGFTALLLET